MRILVVEDEKKVASFIKKGLQQEGYAVDAVNDGHDAFHNATAFDYDLIILDLMLPKLPGLNVLREIRLKKPSLPVLVLTARGAQENTRLRIADLEMDTAARQVRRGGQVIDLKLKEYALLEFLLRHAHRAVTRTMIVEHVWDIHFDSISNVVDVHINSLRNKIDKGFQPSLIHTVRGVGYMLSDRSA